MKQVYVKLGTMPALIFIKENAKIVVGKNIRYKEHERGEWNNGVISRINDDGFMFITMM